LGVACVGRHIGWAAGFCIIAHEYLP
jgi:hypothetical protein